MEAAETGVGVCFPCFVALWVGLVRVEVALGWVEKKGMRTTASMCGITWSEGILLYCSSTLR